jgi:hypothetical protein
MVIEQKNKSILIQAVNNGKRKTQDQQTVHSFVRKQKIQLFTSAQTYHQDWQKRL